MRIRMLTAIAGASWSAVAGDDPPISDGEKRRLLAAGLAELVGELETATIGPPENAALRTRPPEPRRAGRRTS